VMNTPTVNHAQRVVTDIFVKVALHLVLGVRRP
jgi:hypothetical protein